jgi:putative glutamine amidotransferase
MEKNPPIIGLSSCRKMGEYEYHSVYHKYIAVILSLGALPVIIPAVGDVTDLKPLLARIDGILLTGSNSNVQPKLYNADYAMERPYDDRCRDATTLPMINEAVERGLPLFGICRGLQEMNVALGGTLLQEINRLSGKLMHHRGIGQPLDALFDQTHEIDIMPDSWLNGWVHESRLVVNSVHTQAIDRLSGSLALEALAPDGTIEAVRAKNVPGFAYGVQWHPEYHYDQNPLSQAMFTAFGTAVQQYAAEYH